MIGQTISHYRIVEKLGEGGMGVVYIAEDTLLGRRVAVKTLHADGNSRDGHFRTRFLREARAVSALSHPHIATIHDYGETEDGQPYIVMELVKGETLSDLMQKDALTIPRAIEIITQVAEALSEAHSQAIIHRDIKPSNVAINERGNVKVLDFGLAKQLDLGALNASSAERQTLLNTQTKEGVIVGTPMYLSPEQAMGVEVDARSDLFSLGSLLYECIAGKPPFSGSSPVEICAQVIRDDPPPPSQHNPHVPKDLDRITLKAVAKKPADRYQTADEMTADLTQARTKLQTRDADRTITRLISPAPGTHRTGALATLSDIFKRPRLSIGYVAAAVAVVGLIAFAAWQVTRARPHQATAEAEKWYDVGSDDLREGSYFKAIKPLEQALRADGKFALAHARLAEAWAELDYTERAQLELIQVDGLVPDRSVLQPVDALYLDAIRATITRNLSGAISSYTALLRLKPNEPKAFLDLGRAYEKNEEVDKAIENYKLATIHDPQYAPGFLRLGILYGRKEDLPNASAAFDKATNLFQTMSDFEGQTEALYQRGALSNQVGKLSESEDELQRALSMARASSNQYHQIKILLQLSSVLYSRGTTNQAKQDALDAVSLAQNNGIENLATQGLINLGNAYIMRHEYADAEQVFKQALDFAQRNKGHRNEAAALLSLARLYIQEEILTDQVLIYLEQAIGYFREGGYNKEYSQAVLLRGRARLLQGDYDGALRDFQEQLNLSKQTNDQSQLASTHLLIGNLLADMELYPDALRNFEESYSIYEVLDVPLTVGYLLLDKGEMLWRLNRYEEARRLIEHTPEVANRLDNNYKQVLTARIALVNSEISLSQENFTDAKVKAEECLKLSGSQSNHTRVEATYVLGLSQIRSGAKKEGLRLSQQAVELSKGVNDQHLTSMTLLTYAEALLKNDDPKEAGTIARDAQQRFAHNNQYESEWRAWLVAALASVKLNEYASAREQVAHVDTLLANLEQKWGVDSYNSYLARPDVKRLRKEAELLATIH
jgi:serine/threonine protein kinase